MIKRTFANRTLVATTIWVLLLHGCTPYFDTVKYEDMKLRRITQESRYGVVYEPNKATLFVRLTYLNKLSEKLYSSRDYFFLQIKTQDSSVFLPYFTSITLRGQPPVWAREIKAEEFDDILFTDSKWAKGYLIAFKENKSLNKSKLVVELKIRNYKKLVFYFPYPIENNKGKL